MKYDPAIVRQYYLEQGLPEPVFEHRFMPGKRYAFDIAWPDKRLAIEVEGGIWVRGAHARGAGIKRDMEKGNLATLLGWRVLRVEPLDVCMDDTAEMVKMLINENSTETVRS